MVGVAGIRDLFHGVLLVVAFLLEMPQPTMCESSILVDENAGIAMECPWSGSTPVQDPETTTESTTTTITTVRTTKSKTKRPRTKVTPSPTPTADTPETMDGGEPSKFKNFLEESVKVYKDLMAEDGEDREPPYAVKHKSPPNKSKMDKAGKKTGVKAKVSATPKPAKPSKTPATRKSKVPGSKAKSSTLKGQGKGTNKSQDSQTSIDEDEQEASDKPESDNDREEEDNDDDDETTVEAKPNTSTSKKKPGTPRPRERNKKAKSKIRKDSFAGEIGEIDLSEIGSVRALLLGKGGHKAALKTNLQIEPGLVEYLHSLDPSDAEDFLRRRAAAGKTAAPVRLSDLKKWERISGRKIKNKAKRIKTIPQKGKTGAKFSDKQQAYRYDVIDLPMLHHA